MGLPLSGSYLLQVIFCPENSWGTRVSSEGLEPGLLESGMCGVSDGATRTGKMVTTEGTSGVVVCTPCPGEG